MYACKGIIVVRFDIIIVSRRGIEMFMYNRTKYA